MLVMNEICLKSNFSYDMWAIEIFLLAFSKSEPNCTKLTYYKAKYGKNLIKKKLLLWLKFAWNHSAKQWSLPYI